VRGPAREHMRRLTSQRSGGESLTVSTANVASRFAFGLSMDYEVFPLSRITECYDECGDTSNAVANRLQHSGRIITSAAFLVVIVLPGFAAGQIPFPVIMRGAAELRGTLVWRGARESGAQG